MSLALGCKLFVLALFSAITLVEIKNIGKQPEVITPGGAAIGLVVVGLLITAIIVGWKT